MDWMIQRRLFISVLTSFFYGVKKKLQYMLWYEIRKKFSMAIFQNTKIFFTFMFITVKREMEMLITVIRYLSYLIERRPL